MGQKELVLDYMREYGSITGLLAVTDLGVMKLSNRIGELESDGHSIRHDWDKGTDRRGKPTRFVRYYLEES